MPHPESPDAYRPGHFFCYATWVVMFASRDWRGFRSQFYRNAAAIWATIPNARSRSKAA